MPWPVFTFPAPTQLPARAPAVNWRRRGQASAVLLGVLLGHGWLIGPVRQPMGRAPEHAPAIQLVTLPPAEAPQPAAEVTEAAIETAPPAPTPPTPAPPAPTPPAETPPPPTTPEPAAPPDTRTPPPDAPIDWAAGPQAPDPVSGIDPTPAEGATSVPSAPVPGTVASAQDSDDGGGRPPIYTTQRPEQSFKLDYRIERGDDAGTGQLSYDLQTGGVFRVRLTGEVNGKAVVDWISRGFFNAAGFAPRRLIERQRGVEVRATNFQREQGVITFSSSTRAIALYPGAQDRASVLLQVVAIAQAQPGGLRAGQRIRMQVAGLRDVDEWTFEVVGDERVEPNGTPIPVVHLRREPTRPYDQRVELWLAREAGHLPVGLRFTQVPGRASEAYWLTSPLPAPAPAAPASAGQP